MEPNVKQLEKIGLLNEFIASYNILKVYEKDDKIVLNSSTASGQYFLALLGGMLNFEDGKVIFENVELIYDVSEAIAEIDKLSYPASSEIKQIFYGLWEEK